MHTPTVWRGTDTASDREHLPPKNLGAAWPIPAFRPFRVHHGRSRAAHRQATNPKNMNPGRDAMDIRRTRAGLLLAGVSTILVLAACTSAEASLLAAAAGATGTTSGPSTAPRSVPDLDSPSHPAAGQASQRPTGSSGGGPQPGTVICGPVTATETIAICVPAGQEPLAVAAEKVLSSTELVATTSVRIDQGAAMCAVVPADCAGTPPVALVIFARAGASDSIRVLVWRTAGGGLSATRM